MNFEELFKAPLACSWQKDELRDSHPMGLVIKTNVARRHVQQINSNFLEGIHHDNIPGFGLVFRDNYDTVFSRAQRLGQLKLVPGRRKAGRWGSSFDS